MSSESVLLLGGPMHGQEIMVNPDMGSTITVPIMQQTPWTRIPDPDGVMPEPVVDQVQYRRLLLGLPIHRDGWTRHVNVTGSSAGPIYSEVAVWMADDYKPEVDRAFAVVNATAEMLTLGVDAEPEEGMTGWEFYRLQQLHPGRDYISEVSCRLLERALDELDEVIGREH